jgi:NADH-quinone oxidoreductase subunit J
MEAILFYTLAVIAVISALFAITRINPLATALWLILCFISIAGVFGLLDAPIVALFQILLAAGAIMVLFVFVIMLVDLKWSRGRAIRFGKVFGAFAAAYFAAVTILMVLRLPIAFIPTLDDKFELPKTLGGLLASKFAIPFELISILLVIAMVGAVVMGQKYRLPHKHN